jgi:hypothetical protein
MATRKPKKLPFTVQITANDKTIELQSKAEIKIKRTEKFYIAQSEEDIFIANDDFTRRLKYQFNKRIIIFEPKQKSLKQLLNGNKSVSE